MISIDFARSLYHADADSAHDFDHVLRVVHLADRIVQAEGADRDIVHVAALLHDIGLDEGRVGHETSAAIRAKDILNAQGYDETFCNAWGEVAPDYVDRPEGADPHEHTAVHEFHVKLSKIKDRMFTPTGKRLAEERHAFMVTYYEQLDQEVRGEK